MPAGGLGLGPLKQGGGRATATHLGVGKPQDLHWSSATKAQESMDQGNLQGEGQDQNPLAVSASKPNLLSVLHYQEHGWDQGTRPPGNQILNLWPGRRTSLWAEQAPPASRKEKERAGWQAGGCAGTFLS